MVEAVLITDPDGIVVHHNPAAIKLLEIQTDPVIGKPLSDSISDAGVVEMVSEAMAGGKVVSREFVPGTVSRRYLWAYCSPVMSETGKVQGSVTTFQDVSTLKEIDRMKSDFVAMVAHELKSPLASIEQMIYALQVDCEYESLYSCNKLHNRMTVRTKDLLRLIGNLLNLSKLESGTVVFNLEPTSGHEIIEDILEVATPQAEAKKITISYSPCDEDWRFNVDYDHIRTAIMNIVSNAVKYTPDGGSVNISTLLSGGFANLVFADSGLGISSEDLPHIFDRFYRVKGKATRGITGSGLGLSLVKKVVEAHNGSVAVGVVQFANAAVTEIPRTILDSQATADGVAAAVRAIVQATGFTAMDLALDQCTAELVGGNPAGDHERGREARRSLEQGHVVRLADGIDREYGRHGGL
jgi:signal transduction histidine kinase